MAKLTWLLGKKTQPAGMFKFLKKFLTASDRSIISAGNRHILPAPVASGMLMLFDELTDTSAG
jgi:hypothetical protein